MGLVEDGRNFSIDYFSGTGYQSCGLHRHSFHELLFVQEGKLNFLVDDKLYKADGSCIILFKEKRLHTSEVDKNVVYTRYNVNFRHKFIQDITDYEQLRDFFAADCTVIPVSHDDKNYFCPLFEVLYKNFATIESDPYSEQICRHLFAAILGGVSRIAGNTPDICGAYIDRSYISDVVKYINDNLSKKLIIAEIGAVYYVSRAKLMTDFKTSTGITIGDYIISQRLKLAKSMLREGKDVSSTAVAAGFVNACHFIRTFKKHNGVTPLQYAHAHAAKNVFVHS